MWTMYFWYKVWKFERTLHNTIFVAFKIQKFKWEKISVHKNTCVSVARLITHTLVALGLSVWLTSLFIRMSICSYSPCVPCTFVPPQLPRGSRRGRAQGVCSGMLWPRPVCVGLKTAAEIPVATLKKTRNANHPGRPRRRGHRRTRPGGS